MRVAIYGRVSTEDRPKKRTHSSPYLHISYNVIGIIMER